ncbi:MAG TPA: adenylate/guanylate cyclase domain-containing protein [Ignavibacteriaceae bacterium]|nr:adenylate/guanylate cyclase domain-containing protein [Ignavibacteriaceae bacterium]
MVTDAKILIAEDENIISIDISRTLQKLGYIVLGSSRSGIDIIKKSEELKPDLVLMDIILHGDMTGIEAAEIIMKNLDIPVVYLTALADDETLHRAKITEPFGYVLKPFDERTLHSAIEIALYKHKISRQLKERTLELEEERNKSNELLHNIFPTEIVKELKENGFIVPREFSNVTLLFTDFQGFTSMVSKMPPQILVNELNDIFKSFDTILENYRLEKLKTMGDSYMVACGLPNENVDHAKNIICAALEMQGYLNERNKISEYKWIMRAGAHSGNVVAGVVGLKKFTYDVWGNTVNIANLMERYSLPGMLTVTEATFNLVKESFNFKFKEKIDVIGNGEINTYFVLGAK